MTRNWCRCGHHRRPHRGPSSECGYFWYTGKNPAGVSQYDGHCECKRFRPTDVGFWKRHIDGTEEWDAIARRPRLATDVF